MRTFGAVAPVWIDLMNLPLNIATPLASAFVYGVASIILKRATAQGAGPWRVGFATNCIQASLFLPLFLLPGGTFTPWNMVHAMIAGVTFFVGQVFTFLALSRGDVSVATPVLGTKVILVALFSFVLMPDPIPAKWWIAAVLATAATAMMGGGSRRHGDGTFFRSVLYGVLAAAAFSLTDVISQKWAPAWGFTRFAPVMFLTVACISLALLPVLGESFRGMPEGTWPWLIPGALLLGVQALGVAFAIIHFQQATLVNILYSSRGVWTVAIVWAVGHWFGNEERSQGHGVMARRLAGAVLLLAAIVTVV